MPETPRMFDEPVIGEMQPDEIAQALEAMGDPETAKEIRSEITGQGEEGLFQRVPKAWQHTVHQVGYLPPRHGGASGSELLRSVSDLAGDDGLKNKRINVHLQRLRVFEYPGKGTHSVLLTFKAQNQIQKAPEPVGFNQIYQVREGEVAGVIGYPIFIGLSVGSLGVAFQASTVNVKNGSDEKVLNFLNSAPFTSGLNLLTTAQPVLKPFTEMALGLTKMIFRRNENKRVQDFYLGLDFAKTRMGARLAIGDYVVVQVSAEGTLKWSEWQFDPEVGGIVRVAPPHIPIPYNYMVFSVTPFED